jgi:hypothetical protein
MSSNQSQQLHSHDYRITGLGLCCTGQTERLPNPLHGPLGRLAIRRFADTVKWIVSGLPIVLRK